MTKKLHRPLILYVQVSKPIRSPVRPEANHVLYILHSSFTTPTLSGFAHKVHANSPNLVNFVNSENIPGKISFIGLLVDSSCFHLDLT